MQAIGLLAARSVPPRATCMSFRFGGAADSRLEVGIAGIWKQFWLHRQALTLRMVQPRPSRNPYILT